MSELPCVIRHLVGRRSLREEQLHTLQALQGYVTGEGKQRRHSRDKPRAALAAALVFVALAPILAWLSLSGPSDRDLRRRVAEEVAANHLKLKPMEVRTGDISGIRGYFSQLDFLPLQTALPAVGSLEMLGGRYCSVQGVTAAQLRLQASEGEPLQTLYQAAYDPGRFGPLPDIGAAEVPVEMGARGLSVSLWVEKGLLFALIRE